MSVNDSAVNTVHHSTAMYKCMYCDIQVYILTLVLFVFAIAYESAVHLLSLAVAVCSAILLPLAHSLHTSMQEFVAYLLHFLSLLLLLPSADTDAFPV
jgi:hypothetical protein